MKAKHRYSRPWFWPLAGVLLLSLSGASCSVGGDEGSPAVITVESSDPLPDPVPGVSDAREIAIAQCLASKGAVLYGAEWCQYTQKQITSFGDGFDYLTYVECTEREAVCDANGIDAYPTWVIGETRISGYVTPTSIAAEVGCSW